MARKIKCDACEGHGSVGTYHGEEKCELCKGSGKMKPYCHECGKTFKDGKCGCNSSSRRKSSNGIIGAISDRRYL